MTLFPPRKRRTDGSTSAGGDGDDHDEPDADEPCGDDGLPSAGAACAEIRARAHERWMEVAAKAGIDLTSFNLNSTLAERVAWARSSGLDIATILARFSSKLQHSTRAQVEEDVAFAAWHEHYPPPELICVDEAVSGRKCRRQGLDRCKLILERRLAGTILVYKLSRLFRVGYKGYAFFQEDVVEEGLRGISVSQQIDTKDEKTWRKLVYLHGIMDEMLLETIADHVRSGLKSLAGQGFVTGPLPVGFVPVEVPSAPLTNRGRPRTMPDVNPEVGKLIHQHFVWIRDGMPIREGWRRWVESRGPCDPRSTLGYMSYSAYRRMLSNPRYTGCFAFGRTRSVWSSKRDYARKAVQQDSEIAVFQCDQLQIVDKGLFSAVQQVLAEYRLGPRGPKKQKNHNLWDLVTDVFHCAGCDVRFYYSGAGGHSMSCKRGKLCPCLSYVNRKEAVRAVCHKLVDLLVGNAALVEEVILASQQLASQGDDTLRDEMTELEKKFTGLGHKLDDLYELLGQGTEADRKKVKAKIRLAQSQRAEAEAALTRHRETLAMSESPIEPEQIRKVLVSLSELLEAGADGRLGRDLVHRAVAVFRRLVGGRIVVHVERRPGRKRTNVLGVFRPMLLQAIQRELPVSPSAVLALPEVEVWLRQPPKRDLLAPRAYQLVDLDRLSLRDAAAVMQQEGHAKVNSGVVWQLRQRYYEMIGQPAPKLPYNNGHRRRS
jgi:DNA invertase Pin-like site-specific DNA recombinase